jgi:antitoxin component YwqK of YwqJK toxin-antitoxin module
MERVAKYTTEYKNGRCRDKGFFDFENSSYSYWVSWFSNGAKKREAYYYGDSLDGPYIDWYKNGQIRSIGRYIMGKRVGPWRFWSKNGDEHPQR